MAHFSSNTPAVSVKCNWVSNMQGKTIKDTVKICLLNEESEKDEEELSEFLEIRNTVHFIKPNETDVPTVTLKTEDANMCIEKLVFFCDVKTIEVFGNNEMYLSTIHGTSIQASDDFNVYEYKISLNQARQVSLKFVRLSNQDYFWIYTIVIKLKRNLVDKSGSISYEHVEALLKDINISEAARNCLNFMKSTNNASASMSNMSRLSDMFKPPCKPEEPEIPITASTINDLKLYIDYKFQILTEFMIIREKHFNDKLDLVLECLRTKNRG